MDYLLGILGGIAGLFFLMFNRERGRRVEAEAAVKISESNKQDAIIREKESGLTTENQALQAELDRLEKKVRNNEELTPEEVEKYWNGKRK